MGVLPRNGLVYGINKSYKKLRVWVKSRRGCRNGEDFKESHRPFQIFIEILHLETRLYKKLRGSLRQVAKALGYPPLVGPGSWLRGKM